MTIQYRYVQPVDTLTFRGNRLFGDPGSYGDNQFPPRPSVLAGAFRSLLLSKSSAEIGAFAQGKRLADTVLDHVLGTPSEPGSFAVTHVSLARKHADGSIEPLHSLPSDLQITNDGCSVRRMAPQSLPASIRTGYPSALPLIPVLRQDKQGKPESGWLLTHQGLQAYLEGRPLDTQQEHLVKSDTLWQGETRVGIGLRGASRAAEEGRLFSVEHIAPVQQEHEKVSAGLLVGIAGCDEILPQSGLLRLGGDGRAAQFEPMPPDVHHTVPVAAIQNKNRFKLVLQTPGLFENGWLPDRVIEKDGGYLLEYDDLRARLACAAVTRHEVISGWDLAAWAPKDAHRAVPSGSVYWFDNAEGELTVLRKLAEDGLWPETMENRGKTRWAEGYNRVLVAAW